MKSIFLYRLMIIIIICTSSIHCIKFSEEEKLPPITAQGFHTFGCKVDGKTWIPNGIHEIYGTSMPALSAFFGYRPATSSYYIVINAIQDHNDGVETLRMTINADTAGTYIFDGMAAHASFTRDSYFEAITTPSHTGSITITKADPWNRIIAGVFEFRAVDPTSGRVFTITEGRFDARTP